jgi:DNA-binding transcriptional MerR regulator
MTEEVVDEEKYEEETEDIEEMEVTDGLRIDDLVRIFGVTRQTIAYWRKKGLLKGTKMPDGSVVFDVEDVKNLIKKKYRCSDDIAYRVISGEINIKDIAKISQRGSEVISGKSAFMSVIDKIDMVVNKVAELEARLNAITGNNRMVEREIEITEGLKIKRPVELSPKTIQYYNYIVGKSNSSMTIDEFINETIEEHMRECLGVEIGVIVRTR